MQLTKKTLSKLRTLKRYDQWLDQYELVKLFKKKYNRFPRSREEFPAHNKLGRWFNDGIRASFQKKHLKSWQISLLKKIKYEFELADRWESNFQALKKGWKAHPEAWPYVFYYTPHLKRIEKWCKDQRKYYARQSLSRDKIKKLNFIHFTWGPPGEVHWLTHYERLMQWVKKHKCLPKRNSNDAQEMFFAHWIAKERSKLKMGKLNKIRARKMAFLFKITKYNPIHFGWEVLYDWYKRWYREHRKKPKKYAKNMKERRLGNWIVAQNILLNKGLLAKERAAQLIQLKKFVNYQDKK
jgi:hypothetical protein